MPARLITKYLGTKMLHNIRKALTILFMCFGVMSTPSIHATSTIKNIRYAAALLRGPAAYLEYKFCNDTSFRAHAIRIAIDSVRMLDDSLVPLSPGEGYSLSGDLSGIINGTNTRHHLISWLIYDIVALFKDGKACIEGKYEPPVITKDNQKHEFLRGVVLPLAEMICALERATPTACTAKILMSIVRLCELYYAAPQNSAKRKIIGGLLVACVVELIVKSKRMYKLPHPQQNDFEATTFTVDENFKSTLGFSGSPFGDEDDARSQRPARRDATS